MADIFVFLFHNGQVFRDKHERIPTQVVLINGIICG